MAAASPLQNPAPDQAAFLERAIEQHGKATYNFAYRLTCNEADARDLTQEAFVRVYKAWQSFKPGTSFRSWIYRIVTNLHRDELRRRKGRYQEEIPDDNELQEFSGSRPLAVAPIDDYVDSQLSEPLSRALEELGSDQRQIVWLADI
jgi:RNA polymerase sigma-70 factor (ECF subfamily)